MSSEVGIRVEWVTDMEGLRLFLEGLHELWRRDPEAGHSVNDQIRQRVLELCGMGHPHSAALAREVLVTDTWDDCARYCS
jgi:hypothetical protein